MYAGYTLESLERDYANKDEDDFYLYMQAVLGSEKDAARAFDENGNFHCIDWFNCAYCPAFDTRYCI